MNPGPATEAVQNSVVFGGKGRDQLIGNGAGIQFAGFGVAQDAVGLKIAVARVGGTQLGTERSRLQARRIGRQRGERCRA